jgi:hypothetical protein
VIDRYYGGRLLSVDRRTRFELDRFIELNMAPRSNATVHRAGSFDKVRAIV